MIKRPLLLRFVGKNVYFVIFSQGLLDCYLFYFFVFLFTLGCVLPFCSRVLVPSSRV